MPLARQPPSPKRHRRSWFVNPEVHGIQITSGRRHSGRVVGTFSLSRQSCRVEGTVSLRHNRPGGEGLATRLIFLDGELRVLRSGDELFRVAGGGADHREAD